jgi:hypothetical protein
VTYRRARLTLERTGGFAGLTRTYTVDTDQLASERGADYLSLLAELDLAQVAEQSRSAPAHPDQFQYDLHLELDGRRQQLRFGDGTQVAALKTLTRMITSDAP